MNLLMISGDRSILHGKKGAFWYLLEEFSQYWDRIDVICPRVKEIMVGMDTIEGLFDTVYFHPSPRGLWYQPRWIAKMGEALIASHNHSVMSVHEYAPFYNGLGAEWLGRRAKVPYALEVHHIVGYPHAASFTEWIGKVLSHLFLVNDSYGAKAVRCVNREVASTLIRWGATSDQVFIIPSFYLDRSVLQTDPSIEKNYDVVCVGRMVPNKGLLEVIQAVGLLPHVSLLLVGDGPQRAQLEREVYQLGINDRVTFAGWLKSNIDVYRAMQSAKIFVMNSKSEGGPRAPLEAMALGVPVITTRTGVMPDVIHDQENGLLTTGRTADLIEKIGKLLQYSSLREQMGHEARKILDKFERKKLIQRYAEFLQSLAA